MIETAQHERGGTAMTVISLGWGVQSFALAAMSALDMLPHVDVAIHADTTHERSETYAFAARWTPWLEERGIRVVTVSADDGSTAMANGVFVPAFTVCESGQPGGMLRRQCTHRWKVRPIRRWLQANRHGARVHMWFGITLDEITRMRDSDVKYITNRFPFIEMMDKPWTRHRVMLWLRDHGLEIPVKSSCVFCPFHDAATWREIKRAASGDWERAVAVDETIRHRRPGYLTYLARERRPLAEIDFRSAQDMGQMTLWDDAECTGACFL